jgi:hypothetical protein
MERAAIMEGLKPDVKNQWPFFAKLVYELVLSAL